MIFKKILFVFALLLVQLSCFCWGFYAHKKINYHAVFLLPPQMLVLYKPNIQFISEHAVDPDKRRYAVLEEGPRHYIDIDYYPNYTAFPHNWDTAVAKYSKDTLMHYGILPWWIMIMQHRLTDAFKERNEAKILKLSAEIGHYIADAHVPLHASTNHNGQLTNQTGIHAFWESRIPELLADKEWDFFIGQSAYIQQPADFIWQRILESAAAADTVLQYEKVLNERFSATQKYAFENRNGVVVKQYSTAYAKAYNNMLRGMIERRMQQSIYAIASFWYTAWVDAGQPDLTKLTNKKFNDNDLQEFENLDKAWRSNNIQGREHIPNP